MLFKEKGYTAIYKDKKSLIGNVKLMEDSGITVDKLVNSKMKDLLENGHTVMLVSFKNEIIGLISVMDIPRKTAATTLND